MRKYNIIIVENDEDEQLFMKEGFDETGLFNIMEQVENGNALFNWLGRNEGNLPEIILSDLNMPGKNGYDIINEITNKPEWSHIPVIITSTSSTKIIIEKCLAKGAAAYIVKPETFVEYAGYVKELHTLIQQRLLIN